MNKNDYAAMRELARDMTRFLEDDFSKYLRVLEEMIAANSHTLNREGVNRLGDYTSALLAKRGFLDERVPSIRPECGDHRVFTRSGSSDESVGCISHLDTVFTEAEEERNDFRFKIAGDRIYGPGSNDIKGGTVVMLMMLDALEACAPLLFDHFTWILLFDATEETESDDFGALARARLSQSCRACLVFESGDMSDGAATVIRARKGRAVLRATTTGRSAHAGSDHARGASAISQMADLLPRLSAITDYARELTCTVGTINGGTALNRVPQECSAMIELRAFDPEILAAGIGQALSYNGYSSVSSPDGSFSCATTVELLRTNPAWPENPGTEKLVETWIMAAKACGIDLAAVPKGGISDGNLVWDSVPTIDGLGPAGDFCHCAEFSPDGSKDREFALLPSFIPRAVMNALALCLVSGAPETWKKAPR